MEREELMKIAEEYITMGRLMARGYVAEMEKIAKKSSFMDQFTLKGMQEKAKTLPGATKELARQDTAEKVFKNKFGSKLKKVIKKIK